MNRRHIPSALVAALIITLIAHGPVPQLAHYHEFADQSRLLGIEHAGDVLSNAGFAFIAVIGLWMLAPRRRALGQSWPGYLLFLIALLFTACGSTFYHLAPDNARLVWDRLPIALACAGLLAGVRGDCKPSAAPHDATLLALLAIASVAWWRYTDQQGHGDLGPYLLIQGLPLLLIPAWQWICHAPRADKLAFGAALLFYALAKLAELADYQLLAVLHIISGHTLKHLLASAAAAIIVARLIRRAAALEQDDDHRPRHDQRATQRHLPGELLARERDAEHDRDGDRQLVDRRHLADRP